MHQEEVLEFLSVLPKEIPFCRFLHVLSEHLAVRHLPTFLAITFQAICIIIVLLLSA